MKRASLTWRDRLVLALGLFVAVGGCAWFLLRKQPVQLVNGLPVPVQVYVDGSRHEVPRNGRVEISVSAGAHRFQTRLASGEVLEEDLIAVPLGVDFAAYNVAGAAPLFATSVTYGKGASPGAGPTAELLGGRRFVTRDHVDYVFVDPPKSISVDSNSSAVHVRSHVDLAPGGWEATASTLARRGNLLAALRVCREVRHVQPENPDVTDHLLDLTRRLYGLDAAVGLLEERVKRDPDQLAAHRTYQHYLRIGDRSAEAREYYRTQAAARGDDPLFTTLLARVETREAALPLFLSARQKDPDEAFARRSLARYWFETRHYAESAALLAEVAKADPEYWSYVEDHVQALAALGRFEEATAAVKAAADRPRALNWSLAVLYAQAARLSGAIGPAGAALPATYIERLAKSSGDADFGWWMKSLLDISPPANVPPRGDETRTATAIHLAAQRDPGQAWSLCSKASAGALDNLAPSVAILLAAEFLRAGDVGLAETLFAKSGPALNVPISALKAFVSSGVEHVDLWRLDPELRAALDFVRARNLESEGRPAAALYEAAARGDILKGPVSRAMERWPKLDREPPAVHLLTWRRTLSVSNPPTKVEARRRPAPRRHAG